MCRRRRRGGLDISTSYRAPLIIGHTFLVRARRVVRLNVAVGCAALVAAAGFAAVDVLRGDAPNPDGSAVDATPPAAVAPSTGEQSHPAQGREFTVLVSGDVLLRDTLWAQAAEDAAGEGYDFRPMLEGVRPAVSAADLAICHMETPVGTLDGPYSDYPIFNVPPHIIPALAWTGYDACTTASNHTIDKGVDGVTRTLDALDAAGVAHAGSARTADEADEITIMEVGDDAEPARVALLSYTYGLNGLRPPVGKEWIVNLIDESDILHEAERARADGADVVLVALHWGLEYRNEPTAEQRTLAEALLESPDIDLVYGHHAHVVQPLDVINGKWVAYGLGNHLAEQATQPERTHEGVMVRFTLTEGPDGEWSTTAAEYLPTRVPLSPPFRLLDLTQERTSEASEGSYERISELVESLGADEEGLRPAG